MRWLFLSFYVSLIIPASLELPHDMLSESYEDTVSVLVDTLFDRSGDLDGYATKINTPVCEADKCYAIEIIFHWDLIGRFVDYDTIPGQGLTKLDHIPFTPGDYTKLQLILGNENSVLASYQKEELVKNTRVSDIDGFTGATIQEVKDNVIEGAVYSCYTLWHLAHGSIKSLLQQRTTTLFDESLVEKMIALKDQQVNYFLINHFSEEDFSAYLPMVLEAIAEGTGYFPKNAIERMPVAVLLSGASQDFFAAEFKNLNYFTQVAFLKKIGQRVVNEHLLACFEQSLDARNSYRNELMAEILKWNKSSIDK